MTDIFISYARVDVERVEAIAKALEAQGWTVWWDLRSLRTGQSFSKAIEKALGKAECVLVLWSRTSADSHWVDAEASWALRRGKLVSVLLDEALAPPFPYHNLHALDLSGWGGDTNTLAWRKLVDDLTEIVGPPSLSAVTQATGIEVPIQSSEASSTAAAVPRTTGFVFPEPEMVHIQPGTFLMGSPHGEGFDIERPRHEVLIGDAFAIGKYPVTFDEYEAFARATNRDLPDDKDWGRAKRPVINVCWDDAQDYASWLSEQSGKRYRLPTEAEWEYACRGGTEARWSFGDKEKDLDLYGWHSGNSDDRTHPVGEKEPNPWGLYDIHGNVWEWVQDCWHDSYRGAPYDGLAWEAGDSDCSDRRVLRGGSYSNNGPKFFRSAYRYRYGAYFRLAFIGFRLAQDL